jgi:hypothetical protein
MKCQTEVIKLILTKNDLKFLYPDLKVHFWSWPVWLNKKIQVSKIIELFQFVHQWILSKQFLAVILGNRNFVKTFKNY